jgi:hypothetical protein
MTAEDPSDGGLFKIFEVDPGSAEEMEAMGTKKKFWFHHDSFGQSLFKLTRDNTGEDWAEKLAGEFAQELRLPHARYELALAGGHRGALSPNFVDPGATLVHGNELLQKIDSTYVEDARGGYTVERVFDAVAKATAALNPEHEVPVEIKESRELLTGYFMLDALIGNTDRHHENWAVEQSLKDGVSRLYLAPTFDHASSLGRTELEAKMIMRLETRDRQASVEAYAQKARTPFVGEKGEHLSPLDVFASAAKLCPKAARCWIARLDSLDDSRIGAILGRMPPERMSSTAVAFVVRFLRFNRSRLLETAAEYLKA